LGILSFLSNQISRNAKKVIARGQPGSLETRGQSLPQIFGAENAGNVKGDTMPNVAGKQYPYTKAGKKAAAKAAAKMPKPVRMTADMLRKKARKAKV